MKSWPDKSESCFVGETQDSGESSQFRLLKIVAAKWDICFPFKTNKEVIGGKFVPVSVREWGLLRPKNKYISNHCFWHDSRHNEAK